MCLQNLEIKDFCFLNDSLTTVSSISKDTCWRMGKGVEGRGWRRPIRSWRHTLQRHHRHHPPPPTIHLVAVSHLPRPTSTNHRVPVTLNSCQACVHTPSNEWRSLPLSYFSLPLCEWTNWIFCTILGKSAFLANPFFFLRLSIFELSLRRAAIYILKN